MRKEKLEKINEMLDKLDNNYFQVNRKLNENGKLHSWKVYYNNMDNDFYVSRENKPLLSSYRNNENDVEQLIENFSKAKKKATRNCIVNVVHTHIKIFDRKLELKNNLSNITTILIFSFLVLLFMTITFVHDKQTRLTIMVYLGVLEIILAMLINYVNEVIEKVFKNIQYDVEESLIKSELKYRKNIFNPFRTNRKEKLKNGKRGN